MGTNNNILLVEDDAALLEVTGSVLSKAGYAMDTAADGQIAKSKLNQREFALVISDINMPNCNGIDLLKWIRSNKAAAKVILMTGMAELSKTKTAADLGCDAFLAKPVSRSDLLDVVKATLIQMESAEFRESDYARVAIEDFISGKQISHSIYIKLNDGRFLKIAHGGGDIELDRIYSLKARKVNELWLKREDFERYMEASAKAAKFAAVDEKVDPVKRGRLISHACEVAVENLRLSGIREQSLSDAQDVFEQSINVIATNKLGLELLEFIQARDQVPYAHASVCGMLCGLLTKIMGWSARRNIMALTLGGFMHDIGMGVLPLEIQTADPEKMTPEQLEVYKKHPKLGADQLEKLPNAPKELVLIVAQHHENVWGTGFPSGLTKGHIFPMARIVSLVDRFVYFWLKADRQHRSDAPEILKKLIQDEPNCYEESAILALHLLFMMPELRQAQVEYARKTTRLA